MTDCTNCRYCTCYSGDYWTPDDYECQKVEEIEETIFEEAWENGNAEVCPYFEEPNPEEEYWDRYAYEENHYDKDEAE